MMARIRKSMNEQDKGFTLIELLVVMIIIGILAAIAIPVFLNQRKKAVDTAARADVSTLGKETATFYVDADVTATPGISASGGRYILTAGSGATAVVTDIGAVSDGVAFGGFTFGKATGDTNANSWCVDVDITGGSLTSVSYSAKGGLDDKACA